MPEQAPAPVPRELVLPVTGLADANATALEAELAALATRVLVCPACRTERTSEGACPVCAVALVPERRALFTAVVASVPHARVALTLDPRVAVRLSTLETALARREVALDEARFLLAGTFQLVVRPMIPLEAASLRQTLEEAQLFDEVRVETDEPAPQMLVTVRAEKRPLTRAEIAAALEPLKAQLADVVLGPGVPRS